MKIFSKKKNGNKRVISFLGIRIKYKKRSFLRQIYNRLKMAVVNTEFYHKKYIEPEIRRKNSLKHFRCLEIGPGLERIKGFETINVVKNSVTDYIADVQKGIPFEDGTFDLIYNSHFLEHIVWYKVKDVLCEIYRVLKPGGRIEIWVPDGLKIAKAFVDAEYYNSRDFESDGWFYRNDEKDACVWVNGRIFSYGDGIGTKGHWNFHVGLFSERYLSLLLKQCGFDHIRRLEHKECRGYDHGWINLGICAVKR